MGDKGYVVFGAGASEATVKVLTTVCLLKGTAFKHVDVSFDDAALGEEDKLGVKTDTWKSLTAGRSNMPAIAIDGVMHMESELICRKLAKESGASTEVLELIDLSLASSERMIDAVKHWAWSGLHASMGYAIVNKDHYTSFGQGTQTDAWEKESGKVIDTFMKALEAKLAAKPARSGTTSTSPASETTAPTPIKMRARRASTSTRRCPRGRCVAGAAVRWYKYFTRDDAASG